MKIGIVTVFYSENCGSVLQATALSDKIKGYGHEVKFVDTRNSISGHSRKRLVKNCIKAICRKSSFLSVISKYNDYERYLKENFDIVSPKTPLDIVVIGSDTVWDITSDYFLLSQGVFWGTELNCRSISTYAASIANSSYDRLDEKKYPIECIKGYRNISVRDQYTKAYADKYREKPSEMVCDPTLLFDMEYYNKKCIKPNIDKYILLYLFDEPTSEIAEELKVFAKKSGCIIVCLVGMGKRISCADIWVEATISNFLSYMKYADYVLTNTFHGTVFSTIFNKNFVTLDYSKVKVNNFLRDTNLTSRLVSNNIEVKFSEEIDYHDSNTKISELRKMSEEYLEKILQDN